MTSLDAGVWRRLQQKMMDDGIQLTNLTEIHDLLTSLPASEARALVQGLDIPQIMQCLNTSDRKQIDAACDVLGLCFANLTVGDPVRLFASDISKFLTDENVPVRFLAVSEVHRTATGESNLLLPEFIDIILAIIPCIGDSELKIATKAMEIITHSDVLTYTQILKAMKVVLEGNSSAKCNGFDVIVTIASKSPNHLDACVQRGYIQGLVEQLKISDILYQLNILELLSKFALSVHGLNYLINNNILKDLADFMHKLEGNQTGKILIPGLIRFFGSIAHVYPKQIIEEFPTIMSGLFDAINSGDSSILLVSLDTLGFIGATLEGKLSLGSLGYVVISTMKMIGTYIQNSPSEIRLRALNCLMNLVAVETDPNLQKGIPVDHRVTLMTKEWFRAISDHPSAMDLIVSICKIPFPDLKLAAFGVLDAICQHQWGEELVAQSPGFLEFLLNRSIDHSKEEKFVKWEVLNRLSQSASFEANVIMKLKTYVEQGPYYVEATTEVAFEGD